MVVAGQQWGRLAAVNVEDDSHLADLPDLQIACHRLSGTEQAIEYVAPAREIVCANAIKVMGKGFETLDAMAACGRERINVATVMQCYGAGLFFARAFCLLMGFAPMDRQSTLTVDVFRQEGNQVKGMKLHRYERWGHEEVWGLTRRLVDTVKVPESLQETKKQLRRANIKDMPRMRNSFSYDDAKVSPIGEIHSDFPDAGDQMVTGRNAPGEFNDQLLVVKCLAELCLDVIKQADLERHLRRLASARRVQRGMSVVS